MADRRRPKREARRTPDSGAPAKTRVAGGAFTLSPLWALALIALLTVIFFNAVVVGGKTFVSPDTTAPAGFVRIGEKSLYQDHVYPLWNPYVFLGMPSFGSGTYNPLIYPPDWPIALLQKILPLPELTWMLIYFILGAWSMFLLAREWGARAEGALLAGAAFIFAPNLVAVGSHGHGSQLVDSAYVPLMLWLATRWMRGGRISNLGWLALAGGFQMLRGHVQICFYTWLAVALYAFVEWIASFRKGGGLVLLARAAGIGGAAALAFGVAGFYNLPLREYASESIRGAGEGGGIGMERATQWSLSPWELPSIMIPGWVGFGGSTYWGSMPFTDYPNAYVGIVTVLLAIPAFLTRGVARAFALSLALLALMISFGKHFPLYGLLYAHFPLFNKFRIPVMVILLFQVAVALGFAWGWSLVLERLRLDPDRQRRLDRVLLVSGLVLALALVVFVLGQDVWRSKYVAFAIGMKSAPGQAYPQDLAALAYRGFISDLARGSIFGLLALGIAWLAGRGRMPAVLASVLVLALLLFELWPVSTKVMEPTLGDPTLRNLDLGRDDVIEFLEKAGPPGSFRILPVQEFQNNRYAGFGIASLGGYHAAKTKLIQDFLDADLQLNLGWMRLLNIRYIVVPQKIDPAPPYLAEVHAGNGGVVYENQLALPRVTVVGRYHVVQPAKAILDSVKNDTGGSDRMTYLEEDPKLALGPVEGAKAEIVSYKLNEVTIEVDTPGPALVRLADLWSPEWKAYVDGRSVRVLKADYLLRAVPVPAGRHTVVFRFESPSLALGLKLSIASLLVALVLILVGPLLRRLRQRPTTMEPAVVEAG